MLPMGKLELNNHAAMQSYVRALALSTRFMLNASGGYNMPQDAMMNSEQMARLVAFRAGVLQCGAVSDQFETAHSIVSLRTMTPDRVIAIEIRPKE